MTDRWRPRRVLPLAVVLAGSLVLASCSLPLPSLPTPSAPSPTSSTRTTAPTVSTTAPTTTTASPTNDAFPLPQPAKLYTDLTSPDRTTWPLLSEMPLVPGMVDPPGPTVDAYLNQTIAWGLCTSPIAGELGAPYECASVLVPLDWHHPESEAITLHMKRKPATKQPSLGDLFINPGGPGGVAQSYVDAFATAGLEQYTIVGVDPRGSGESTPVVCGSTAQTQAYFDLDASPDTQAERDALVQGTTDFAHQCWLGSGALLKHISTIEAVYDFELIRRLLGDDTFNYLGVSYGTFIGAVYAELYPEHAGRMVLDAAVNITDNQSVAQTAGFEVALHEYAKWCATDQTCQNLGTSEDAVIAKIRSFLDGLDAKPIAVGSRPLTQTLAVAGIALYMYLGTDGYSNLTGAILYAAVQGDGQYLLRAADYLNGREDDGTYGSLALSFPAIACLDAADKGVDDAWRQWDADAAASPFFGHYMGPNLTCPLWSAQPAPQIDFTGAGDPPLVVIGGTGDNATPYQYAQWMADKFPSAVLVTREGVGHGSYDSGNACIDSAVVDFLAKGVVPKDGLTCS